MCEDCGCAASRPIPREEQAAAAHSATVVVMRRLLAENDRAASHNRLHFDAAGVFAVNLMSSPGSGKTALIEATIEALRGRWRIGVVEGDLATENDAERIRRHGVPAVQINTGTACHLDAHMVHDALHDLPLAGLDLVFIENVGNLVCPAAFDLGQHRNVTLLSVTEGDDKPAKYPVMFRASDLVLLSKADLLRHFDDFDPNRVRRAVRALANDSLVLTVSSRSADGLLAWLGWLDHEIELRRLRSSSTAMQAAP